jgi:hypothetical protein
VVGGAAVIATNTLRILWEHRDEPWAVTLLALFAAWIAVYTLFMLLGGLASHVLRVALTPTQLHVHHGVVAQVVPLEAVTAVTVDRARPRPSLLGALLRRERVFTVAGGAATLRVAWRDARGRARTTWVQFDAAPAFARRIEALTQEGTGVRVAADDDGAETAERAEAGEGQRADGGVKASR